ncbi:MAG: 4Fe-4S binding protein [Mogibacterium sp.]|nr:4Fe-4S binding protein [Mogibacterium sp.]
MKLKPIYSEDSNCRDCYKCVRTCPVKAIRIRDAHAEIMHDRCTYCGICIDQCPNGAKQIRNDVDLARMALLSRRKVIASVAPSFVSEFAGRQEQFIRALYQLGFDAISETAIGAALVSEALDLYLAEHGEAPFISTACPSVVELVRKYCPDRVRDLAPVPSPLQTHCAYLRHLYGDDISIVFIGPCIAKKVEADEYPGYPDVALTYREVRGWFEEEGIDPDTVDTGIPVEFVPCKAGRAGIYPVENGQIETSRVWMNRFFEQDALAVSGMERIMQSLSAPRTADFLETLNCSGGCINGPGTLNSSSDILRKRALANYVMTRLSEPDIFTGDPAFAKEVLQKGYGIIRADQPDARQVTGSDYTEAEIRDALLRLGKAEPKDELNCSGCGYATCRDMAKALLAGFAEPEMCVTKMRKDAESKVDILLSTIPHGVAIVDSDLGIVDCNKCFIEIFEDFPEEFLTRDGLRSFRGMPVETFVPFSEKFREQFFMNRPAQYRFRHNGRVMRVTFFLVESRLLLGALFEDITTPVIRREAIIEKTEEVLSKSLNTVQRIASLLGENAAETEIVLNSILEEFNMNADPSQDHGLIRENSEDNI